MLESPILRTLFLFLGCYFLVNFLGMFGWLLPVLAVASAGIVATVTWLYHVDYPRLSGLYTQPWAAPVIGFVCRTVLGVQSPVGTNPDAVPRPVNAVSRRVNTSNQREHPRDTSQESAKVEVDDDEREDQRALRLVAEADYARAEAALVATVRGLDAGIARLLRSVRTNVEVRALSARDAVQPPLGIYLCVGPKGLGKQSLARAFARQAYAEPSATVIDLADATDGRGELLAAARQNPHQTILLLDIDRASEDLLRDLSTIAEKGTLKDGKGFVSFRHCFLFLCLDRAADACQRLRAMAAGSIRATSVIQVITQDTAFDARLASVIDEMLFFELPPLEVQAEVVLALMQEECQKYELELARVDPEVLMREVRSIERTKSFEQTPGRIAKRLRAAILAARAAGSAVEVSAGPDDEPLALAPSGSTVSSLPIVESAREQHASERDRQGRV